MKEKENHDKAPAAGTTQHGAPRGRRRRNNRPPRTPWLIFIAIFLLLWIVQETIKAYTGMGLWKTLTHPVLISVELIGFVLSFIFGHEELRSYRRSDNFWNDARRIVSMLRQMLTRNTYIGLPVLLVVTLYLTSGLAQARVMGHGLAAASEYVGQIMYTPPPSPSQSPSPAAEVPVETGVPVSVPSPPAAPSNIPTLSEPDREYRLSDEKYSELYLLAGPYAVFDWKDPSSVSDMAALLVEDRCGQHRSNQFDISAPESLKGDVATASRLEETIRTTKALEEVIDIREQAWAQYPKYGLAKLLASNYQLFALAYLRGAGNPYTIEYYYGQSVFWCWESLTFDDILPSTQKNILHSIATRYHDLADLAANTLNTPSLPEEARLHFSKVQDYAQLLSNAFSEVQNFY